MTERNDVLDQVAHRIPPPDGSLARLHRRHEVRQRNRRLATGAAVLAVWIALAIVAVTNGANEAPRPADESDRPSTVSTPTPFHDFPLTESAALPASFPTDLPLPEGIRPVASQGTGYSVQVWFRSDVRGRDLYDSFAAALPAAGWERDGNSAPFSGPGIWDFHVRSEGRAAIVLGLKDVRTTRLLHGSGQYPPEEWDLYIVVTPLGQHVPE